MEQVDISEVPDAPRKKDVSFYLVLLFIVAPVWSFVPLSWIFVLYSLCSGNLWTFLWPGKIAFTVALCEVFFSVHQRNLARYVSSTCPHGPGNLADLQATLARVLKTGMASLPEDGYDEESLDPERPGSPAEDIIQLEPDDPRAIDFRNSLRTWFGRRPWSSIKLHQVRQWLQWAMFNSELPPLHELSRAHRAAIDETVEMLQKRSGKIFEDTGVSFAEKPMRLTLDPVNILCRPFTFYVLIAVINCALHFKFERFWNARYGSYEGLEYLIRIPESWDSAMGPRPLVLIHGLGLGLFQYKPLLTYLLEHFPDRPILFLLQPHISQNIFHPQFLQPMNRHQTAQTLAGLIEKLGWASIDDEIQPIDREQKDDVVDRKRRGVTMISHSNGSYAHAWMLKGYPSMITRSCFVDPVTFCSWEGDTCYNFIYRPCATGLELIMRYFVGTELGVANLLQKHFDWASNSLWYEEIPNARDPTKTMFFLGGQDAIVNAERVKKYLTSHGVRKGLWFHPDGHHGQALIPGGEGRREIARWLREYDY